MNSALRLKDRKRKKESSIEKSEQREEEKKMARTFFRRRDWEAPVGPGTKKETGRDAEAARRALEKKAGCPVAPGQGQSRARMPEVEKTAPPDCAHLKTAEETDHSRDRPERRSIIFDDTDVCALLGLRRRELVKRRTEERRGIDWDVAGAQAGMTATWIRSWNRHADLRNIKPVEPGDGIVTVRVAGRVLNGDVVRGMRVADGTCVTVRGIRNAWYLRAGDELDCRLIGGGLAFDPALNREKY